MSNDLIRRQDAISALLDYGMITAAIYIERIPSAQPTVYGYDIEQLMLIADILSKENLPPEKVSEALTDIGRIVTIVADEFAESLRKAVEQI